jgi:hypothetical protein
LRFILHLFVEYGSKCASIDQSAEPSSADP